MGYKDWGCWNLVSGFYTDRAYGFLKYNCTHNGGTVNNPIDFDDLESFAKNNYVFELQDFDAIVDEVHKQFDNKPDIYVIGHSRGGGIALLQSDNGHVKKISSWAGISNIGARFPHGDLLDQWKKDGKYFRTNGRTNQQMPHNYSQFEVFQKHRTRLNIELYCRNSNTPTQVIHGDEDVSVNIKDGEQIASWLHTDLVVIKGAQHTFGSSQPWSQQNMPDGLEKVCQHTYEFFEMNNERSKNSDQEKLSILSDLVKLAKADDSIRDIEFQFLMSIAGQMGVTKDEFKTIFEENIKFSPPKLEVDRIVQFQRLVLLMNVDLEANEKEINYIKDIGIRMGLHPDATNAILEKMHKFENKIIPPDELISIFKTFHN